MKKLFAILIASLLAVGTCFAYTYWEFDAMSTESGKGTIFHTINVDSNIASQEGFNDFINDYHQNIISTLLDGFPSSNTPGYESITWEITEAFYNDGKTYRIIFGNYNNDFYCVTVYVGNIKSSQLRLIKSDDYYLFNLAHDTYDSYVEEFCKNF